MAEKKLNVRLVAILISISLITFAVWHTTSTKDPEVVPETAPSVMKGDVPDLQATDHVRGNPDATLLIVVYSDFQCPYCKDFHATMERIMDLYGTDGTIAWVYRHMPIVKLHPESATYALASECVAQQAGNGGFWDYADLLYQTITPEKVVESSELTALAETVGVSREDFVACMRSGDLMQRVEQHFNESLASGAQQTPYIVIITPYQQIAQEGAQPFPSFAGTLKTMLRVLGAERSYKAQDARMPNYFDDMQQETSGTTTQIEQSASTSLSE